eukprot:2175712-Rhodomonas_salina.1
MLRALQVCEDAMCKPDGLLRGAGHEAREEGDGVGNIRPAPNRQVQKGPDKSAIIGKHQLLHVYALLNHSCS